VLGPGGRSAALGPGGRSAAEGATYGPGGKSAAAAVAGLAPSATTAKAAAANNVGIFDACKVLLLILFVQRSGSDSVSVLGRLGTRKEQARRSGVGWPQRRRR